MGLPAVKTADDFTFKHTGQPDEYGVSVGDYMVVQANLDSRAIFNQTQINAIINALKSITDGDSGADNTYATAIEGLTGTTVQALLESFVSVLKSVTDGSSGADFINVTEITGLTGSTVQALLEALKAYIDTKDTAQTSALNSKDAAQTSALNTHKSSTDHDSRYTPTSTLNAKLNATTGAPTSIGGVSNATGDIDLVSGTGITITPDNAGKKIRFDATGESLPAAHASTHASGGSDEITPSSIGAIPSTEKGTANGVATTDSSGNVPASQLGNVDLRLINKELANIEAVLDVDNRALQNNGKVYDLLDGTNTYSCGILDTTKTTTTAQIYANDATTLIMPTHGLATGDLINNTTRSKPSIVTKVNNDVLTTDTITGQIAGDSIKKYPKQISTTYTSDLCTGGTAISSGDAEYTSKVNAYDNNSSSTWGSSQVGSGVNGVAYIGYQFTTSKHIRKITIKQHQPTGITSAKIQRSSNGTDWTDVQTITLSLTENVQTFTINESGTSTYWRLLANSASSDKWTVYEIEMMEFAATFPAESGTTTTNIKITGHGLSTGDFIRNTSRSNAIRQVTKVDNDNLTVAEVASQTTSDAIEIYKYSADDTAEAISTISVTSSTGFAVGQEITIFDDVNFERPIISAINGNNLTFTSGLTYGYKNAAVVCRSSVTVDTIGKTIKFGGFGATPVLVEDFRYNITPPLGTTDELVMWLYNEKDADFSISSSLSIVDTSANESYTAMTKTTTALTASTEENQFVGSVVTAQEKVTFRGTITRNSTSLDKSITKVLGAIA